MSARSDLAVIGAGPAGLAAAALADELGLDVVLLDEQAVPGGQIYRAIERSPLAGSDILGEDYEAGRALVEGLRASRVQYLEGASVWQVSPDLEIGYTRGGTAALLEAQQVILATGAMERPVPVPGWTLPGVMTAGAAQILLKSAGVAASGAVFAGSGPLLYLAAWQYCRAGIPVTAVLDTTPWANYLRAVPRLRQALRAGRYLAKGLSLIRDLRRMDVPLIAGVGALRAEGAEQLRAVTYERRRRWQTLDTEALFLHQGVVPDMNLAAACGCAHDWSDAQLCWRPRLGAWGETSVEGIAVAGDVAGISGAAAAALQGRLAALGAASRLGRLDVSERDRRAAPIRSDLAGEEAVRPFLERLYRPAPAFRVPEDDETVVCRCEEVRLGDIRAALEAGCPGPNQLKSFLRCGMGPCQGRLCGLSLSEIISTIRGVPVAEVGHLRLRPPVKPLRLDELASLDE
jgi:NADPH-dependent 2,4-dienoyl-CoA reductase/sulfur reductase-like enzyme